MSTTMFAPFATAIKQPEPETRVILVTPEMATEWLSHNMKNRSVRKSRVALFARKMASGQWHVTNQGVGFDRDGVLIDGQHRLLAVVMAGVPVRMNVTKNLEPEARLNVDTGSARTAADTLSVIHGTKNAAIVAAIAKKGVAWDLGFRWMQNYDVSIEEIEWYANTNAAALGRAAEVGSASRKYVAAPPSLVAFGFYLCARVSADDAEKFFVDQLIEGIGLTITDPARVLNKSLSDGAHLKGTAAEFRKLASIISGWNSFRAGKRIQRIHTPSGGWSVDNYPEPK